MAKVSIILPNLNTPAEYLKDRVTTILDQTFNDWECIIVDGYSDNGSWEYLKEMSQADARFRSYQFKKEGIYKAWNSGIKLAKGEYVYIATSDDTFEPLFLEKMVGELDENATCDIAHCCLTIIDEIGKPSTTKNWDEFYPTQYFGGLMKKRHIRLAPHDGILHCGIKTVYTSITQLLIRRSVFDKVGYFLIDHGSISDFEWGMRASLVCNVLHVPEYLATWRCYTGQATTESLQSEYKTYETLSFFIDHAIYADAAKKLIDNHKYNPRDLQSIYLNDELRLKVYAAGSLKSRLGVMAGFLKRHPGIVITHLLNRFFKIREKDNLQLTGEMMKNYKLSGHIKSL